MKKIALLLFTTIFLSSCKSNMGGTDNYWIVHKIQSNSIRNSNATYTVVSFDGRGYYFSGIKFEDQYGKFQIGDTVELVKLKH